MTAQQDLDRALGTWFGAEAAPAPPPERLASIVESTRAIRPRPALIARAGSGWVGSGPAGGQWAHLGSLRPALVIALVALFLVALVSGVLWAGTWLTTHDPDGGEIVPAPDLSRPMAAPALVPLLDDRVLAIGNGGEGGDPTVTAEIYDPTTGTSKQLGPVATPRGFVDWAGRLNDGRVLILADGVASVFDPATLRTTQAGPMVVPRRAPAMVLHDGRVLVAGGITPGGGTKAGLVSAELFDPDALTFAATGSSSGTPGAMATLSDGRVFVALDGTDSVEIYDPTTGAFSPAGSLMPDFGVSSVISLPDGRVVVFGSAGMGTRRYTEVWDPSSSAWSMAAAPPGPIMGATLLDDGRIFLLHTCGDATWGDDSASHRTSLFDPATGEMSAGPPTAACRPSMARLADGRVLLAGGLSGTGSYIEGGSAIHDTPAVATVEIFR